MASRRFIGLGLAGLLVGCSTTGQPLADANAEAPEESPTEFVARVNAELEELSEESGSASWIQSTYINKDSARVAARAQERNAAFHSRAVAESAAYDLDAIDPVSARAIRQLSLFWVVRCDRFELGASALQIPFVQCFQGALVSFHSLRVALGFLRAPSRLFLF